MIDKNILDSLYLLEGEQFIRAAYQKILLREVDGDGLKTHSEALDHGQTKADIIFKLLTSKESYLKNIEVTGFQIGSISAERLLSETDNDSFIRAAYIAVLGRNVDATGLETHSRGLLFGNMDRLDILIALYDSPEGKMTGTRITGMRRKRARRRARNCIYRIPVAGRGIRFLRNLVHISRTFHMRLGNMEQHLNNMEQHVNSTGHSLSRLENQVDGLSRMSRSVNAKKLSDGEMYLYKMLNKEG